MNPLSGAADDNFRLVDGGHRRPGAVYAVSDATVAAGAKQPAGVTLVQLREEHRGRTDLAITSLDDSFWRTDVAVHHHAGKRLPRAVGEAKIDLTQMLRESSKEPLGCGVAWLVGRRGTVSYELDTGVLDGSAGRLAHVSGRVNRFPFSVVVDVAERRQMWEFDVRLTLRARGIARPVLWFAGRRIRRGIDDWFSTAWPAVARNVDRGQAELRKLAVATEAAGGPEAFIRRELWSDEAEFS